MANREQAIGVAALWASLHILNNLAGRGLASPSDVEAVYESIREALETLGDEQFAARTLASFDGLFAEMRDRAQQRFPRPPS